MTDLLLKDYIIRLKKSDRNAFKAIVEHFDKTIFNFLVFRLNSKAIAEDLLQETFIRLWENREHLNEQLSIKSYLFTTASNLSLNYIRHEKVALQFSNWQKVEEVMMETPYSELEYQELSTTLEEAIGKMTEKVRMAFLLCRVEGLSYREAAERMQVSVATVESHMVKGLRTIREELDKYNREDLKVTGQKGV